MKNNSFMNEGFPSEGKFQLRRYIGDEKLYNFDMTESSTPILDYSSTTCLVLPLSSRNVNLSKFFTDFELNFLTREENEHFRFEHEDTFDLSDKYDMARIKLIFYKGKEQVAESEHQIKREIDIYGNSDFDFFLTKIE